MNKAPALIQARDFSKARPSEMVKVEFEFLQPDGAEAPLYHYPTPYGVFARRYWAIRGKLLVGGHIRDASDWMHLVRDFGITDVLSFESEFSDENKVSDGHRACVPFEDNGRPPPIEPLIQAVKWVKNLPLNAILYCHCHLGGSRGPTAAYLALRTRWNMNRETAQKYAGRRQCGSALFTNYINGVDEAILAVTGRGKDE